MPPLRLMEAIHGREKVVRGDVEPQGQALGAVKHHSDTEVGGTEGPGPPRRLLTSAYTIIFQYIIFFPSSSYGTTRGDGYRVKMPSNLPTMPEKT